MRTHVTWTASRCFGMLRQLRTIKRSVPADTFQRLVVSLVLSRLDYGNATLASLPASLLSQLQAVMNAGARLIFNANQCEHVTPLLRQLHWLRVAEQMTFKLPTVTAQWHWCSNASTRQLSSWLPISRRETSRRCTRTQTPTLSRIIFTCHPIYPTFFN